MSFTRDLRVKAQSYIEKNADALLLRPDRVFVLTCFLELDGRAPEKAEIKAIHAVLSGQDQAIDEAIEKQTIFPDAHAFLAQYKVSKQLIAEIEAEQTRIEKGLDKLVGDTVSGGLKKFFG